VKYTIFCFIFFYISPWAFAQDKTYSILIFDYKSIENKVSLSNAKNIASFNKTGYVNQPFFIDDNNLYVTSDHGDGKYTDIYKLNLSLKTIERITKTEQISEFSPTISKDGKSIFSVRMEKDEKTQSLWQYPSDKSGFGLRILKNLSTIGYYKILDDKSLVIFSVGSPNILGIYDTSGKIKKSVDTNPGRSFNVDLEGNIIYTNLDEMGTATLKKYNQITGLKEILITLPSQYFEIMPDGNIISSKGTSLYIYDYKSRSLNLWADFSSYIKSGNITRVAVTKNKLALVVEH
jgi:outer membrane protein assembly factor BamB